MKTFKKILTEAVPRPGQVPLGGVSSGDANIHVPGVGVYKYDSLKKNVIQKLEYIIQNIQRDDFGSVGDSQFRLISSMYKTLQKHAEGK